MAWSKLEKVAGSRSVDLADLTLPPAPDGFTDADVRALADRLIDLVHRSMASELSGMTADEAVDHVFAQLPAQTLVQLKDDVAANQTKLSFAWQWALASRFPNDAVVSDPRYLDGRLSAKSVRSSSGTYLSVELETHIASEVSIGEDTRTVVLKRGLLINSFQPQGISEKTWPAVGFSSDVYGADLCLGFRSNIVAPAVNVRTVEKGVEDLREDLGRKAVSGAGTMSSEDFAFIKRQLASC